MRMLAVIEEAGGDVLALFEDTAEGMVAAYELAAHGVRMCVYRYVQD